jgi:hypothetical protein
MGFVWFWREENGPPGTGSPTGASAWRGDPNPLDVLSWQDLRDEIYGGADR